MSLVRRFYVQYRTWQSRGAREKWGCHCLRVLSDRNSQHYNTSAGHIKS